MGIFSSRVAVLARPQGGSIQNHITRPKRNAIIYLLYDSTSTKSGKRKEKSEGGKEKEKKTVTTGIQLRPTERKTNHSTTEAKTPF